MKRIWMSVLTMLTLALVLSSCAGSKKAVEVPVAVTEETPPPPPVVQEERSETVAPKETARAALSLSDVRFDFDRYDLRPDMLPLLAEHVRQLRDNPRVRVRIEGHCDEMGTAEYNLALGERRANAVRQYLLRSGIAESRISTVSFGKEKPLDTRHTAEAWAKNRRAAFVLIDTSKG